MIELIPEPRIVKKWEEFVKENPPFSIALDGYVYGAPNYQSEGPRLNLNHHEDVDRLSTFSTSMQAYVRLKLGLFDKFNTNGEPRALIYVNDPDQDSSLAAFVLAKHEISSDTKYQNKLEELLHYEQLMDITGGMFPVDINSKIMKQMAWIFGPYDAVRMSGKLYSMNSNEMKDLMQDIFLRIENHLFEKSKEISLDTFYTILNKQNSFAVVKENSTYSRTKMVGEGIKSFASVISRNDGVTYTYTLAKISDFISISLPKLYDLFNQVEGIQPNDMDRWGGSKNIGGSPRKRGSNLSPEKLFELVKIHIKDSK